MRLRAFSHIRHPRPDVPADLCPLFARMRKEDPVHWSSALKGWMLTRYDDVNPCPIGKVMI